MVGMQTKRVNWVLDADIKAFFDTVDHARMMRFLEHRIGDTRIGPGHSSTLPAPPQRM